MKMIAEWFWTDRWMGSSAFLLPMEARGVYREMLSQAWRRGARLPADHDAIKRAIGASDKEWARAWPKVEKFWRVDGDSLVNDTQLEVYAEAEGKRERAQARAQAAAQARHKQVLKDCPPSPSPITTEQTGASNTPSVLQFHGACVVREPDAAAIDRLDAELEAEEKRFSALALAVRDSGEDVQCVLDSLPRPKTQTPFSARRWLATGLTGIARSEGGLTVLRLTCDALEARARAHGQPQLSDANRQTLENIRKVGDRMKAQQAGSVKEIQ